MIAKQIVQIWNYYKNPKYFSIIESIKDIDLKNIKKRDKFSIIYRNNNKTEKW